MLVSGRTLLDCYRSCKWPLSGRNWYDRLVKLKQTFPQAVLDPGALPLYQATARQIRDDLLVEGAASGDHLPSERSLADRYGISRDTLRSALIELQQLGIVEARPARGWFVATSDEASEATSSRVLGFADLAASSGLTARTRVLSARVRPATVAEAETLRAAPGSELFELRRLRYLDGLIIVAEYNRLPLSLCPELSSTNFNEASLYATLRAATPPQVAVVADYSVEARPPSAEERQLLEIDGPVPLLVATQLAYNQDSRPLELTKAAYRGDRYRFKASISNR